MARIGLKYPIYAKYNTDSGGTVTYSNGTNIGKAIKADVSITTSNTAMYGDDEVAERINEFVSGTISLETTDLSIENYSALLGHDISGTANSKEITSKDTDAPIYVGFGFYGRKIVDNVHYFRAIWFTKVIFGEPSESFETKGNSITFGSYTIEGAIESDTNGVYKVEQTFTTETEAVAWLKGKANISTT